MKKRPPKYYKIVFLILSGYSLILTTTTTLVLTNLPGKNKPAQATEPFSTTDLVQPTTDRELLGLPNTQEQIAFPNIIQELEAEPLQSIETLEKMVENEVNRQAAEFNLPPQSSSQLAKN